MQKWTRILVKGYGRVRVGLELGLGVGLGGSELLIADCRYGIRGDRVSVAGTGYTTY